MAIASSWASANAQPLPPPPAGLFICRLPLPCSTQTGHSPPDHSPGSALRAGRPGAAAAAHNEFGHWNKAHRERERERAHNSLPLQHSAHSTALQMSQVFAHTPPDVVVVVAVVVGCRRRRANPSATNHLLPQPPTPTVSPSPFASPPPSAAALARSASTNTSAKLDRRHLSRPPSATTIPTSLCRPKSRLAPAEQSPNSIRLHRPLPQSANRTRPKLLLPTHFHHRPALPS